MSNHKITPEKVTRPFQLLAAWLTGLCIVNGAFLWTATHIDSPKWAASALVVAAIVNVPLFLVSIFVLQTKYRPEMQEDVYYSKYLEYQYSPKSIPSEIPDIDAQTKTVVNRIIKQIGPEYETRRKEIESILHDSQVEQIARHAGGSRTLSELFLRQEHWPTLMAHWDNNNPSFRYDVTSLLEDGLIAMEANNYSSCRLTTFGQQVAQFAHNHNMLYQQQDEYKKFWEEQGRLTNRSRD